MIINKIEDRWVICNYNFICLLPITDYMQNDWEVREHFRHKIDSFCKNPTTPDNLEDMRTHAFGPFIEAGLINIIINTVKVALWEGMTEQTLEVFKDSDADSILVRVNEDFTVSVDAMVEGCEVPIITPIPLDDLEFFERDDVQNILSGMNERVAEECYNKAKALRNAVGNSPLTQVLSDCDITLLTDEGLRDLLK